MVATKQTNMQIPKQQVEALIEQGQKRGLTGKDVIDALVRKGYEPEGVNVMAIKAKVQPPVQQTTPETSFLGGLKEDLNTRVDRVGEIQNRTDSSGLEKTVQTFGQGAGLAANAIEKTVEQIPGVKQAFGAIGAGINWLSQPDNPITRTLYGGLIDYVGNSKWAQETTQLYDTDQNFKDSVDAVANIARLGGDVEMAADAVNLTKNVVNKIKTKINTVLPDGGTPPSTPLLSPEGQAMVDKVIPDSASIMNRVARLKPTDATKFEKLAGKTHGEYLKETGNFGTPDQIITKEAQKFSESIGSVDNELAKLPGVYKDGSIADALTELSKKASAESGANIKAPYASRVSELSNKFNTDGLNMSEINEVKRLFEKNVKLGYNKLINGEKVAQATNIDSALRDWQVFQAEKLGFKNIGELNKQTQLSKFIIDKLGDQVVGQGGLNGVSLTDWIMLSGGSPESIAGFLTKKFFSSKGVQSRIAEFLNKGDKKSLITPETTITPENINRRINPSGNLALPEGKSPVIENRVPIQRGGKFEMEKSTPRTSTTQLQQPTKKVKSSSPKSTTKSLKVKGTIPENSLISEAKKYKTAEEFVNRSGGENVYHGGSLSGEIDVAKGERGFYGKGFYVTDTPEIASKYNKNVSEFKLNPSRIVERNAPLSEDFITKFDSKFDAPDAYTYGEAYNHIVKLKGEDVATKFFAENGVDGWRVKSPTGLSDTSTSITVFNKDALKTKSQLTDIWKKAQGLPNLPKIAPVKVDPLITEARKYKSAEEFANNTPSDVLDKLREAGVRGGEQRMKFWEDATGKKTGTSYQMSHRPSEGVSAFDLTEKVNGEQMIPKDMYTQWYGSRGTATDLESISVLKKIKGKPEADVTIYRASPKESFNEGDWVTFSKKYAQEHAKGNNTKVFSKVVKAKDVRWAMDDVNEFGYFPKSQLTDIWKKANKK